MNLKRIFLVPAILFGLAAPLSAEVISLSELSQFLNDLTKAKTQFTQINPDGTIDTGTLYIHRPGRMRFEYNAPSPALVIAGGGTVAIFDTKSNEPPQQFPLKRTPLQYRMGVIPWGRQSSAFGFSQALDNTWDEYRRKEGGSGAKRQKFDDAVDFMGWYIDQANQRVGISKVDVRNQYFAYHEGYTGYKRGSYRSKPWLVRIAGEIQNRAVMYESQLANCR